jgi:hypothetical protein
MKLPRRIFLHLAAGAAALPVASRVARAQAYPSRPVTLIVFHTRLSPVDACGPPLRSRRSALMWHELLSLTIRSSHRLPFCCAGGHLTARSINLNDGITVLVHPVARAIAGIGGTKSRGRSTEAVRSAPRLSFSHPVCRSGAAPQMGGPNARNSTHSPAAAFIGWGVSKFMDGTSARFFLRM